MDTYQNIKTYFQRSNVVSNKTRKIPTDDNEYLESTFTNRSDISKLEENIMLQGVKQQTNLQPLIDLKKSNDIPNAEHIHSQIGLNVLDERFDNSTYNKKDGDSFWKMLFMPPKYYELVNNQAQPYYKFNID